MFKTLIYCFSIMPRARPLFHCLSIKRFGGSQISRRTQMTSALGSPYKLIKNKLIKNKLIKLIKLIKLNPPDLRVLNLRGNLVQTKSSGTAIGPSYLSCGCPSNVECLTGMLLNYSISDREEWLLKNLTGFIGSCSSVALKQSLYLERINQILDQINGYNFCPACRIINPSDFYSSLACYYTSLPIMPVSKSVAVNLASAEEVQPLQLLAPVVCVFLNKITGKRLFFHSQGLSCSMEKPFLDLSLKRPESFINYKRSMMPFPDYKSKIMSMQPALAADFKNDPSSIMFYVLKMGVLWRNPLKRENLVKRLSIKSGVFTYDISRYNTKKYTAEDLLCAQKRNESFCNTKIPWDVPIHLDGPGMSKVWRKTGTSKDGDYKNLSQASRHLGICKNQLAYSIFSQDQTYQNCCLIVDQNFDLKNKLFLSTLEISSATRKKKFPWALTLSAFPGPHITFTAQTKLLSLETPSWGLGLNNITQAACSIPLELHSENVSFKNKVSLSLSMLATRFIVKVKKHSLKVLHLFINIISVCKYGTFCLGVNIIKNLVFYMALFKSNLKNKVIQLIPVLQLIKTGSLGKLKSTLPLFLLAFVSLAGLASSVTNPMTGLRYTNVEAFKPKYSVVMPNRKIHAILFSQLPFASTSISMQGVRLPVPVNQDPSSLRQESVLLTSSSTIPSGQPPRRHFGPKTPTPSPSPAYRTYTPNWYDILARTATKQSNFSRRMSVRPTPAAFPPGPSMYPRTPSSGPYISYRTWSSSRHMLVTPPDLFFSPSESSTSSGYRTPNVLSESEPAKTTSTSKEKQKRVKPTRQERQEAKAQKDLDEKKRYLTMTPAEKITYIREWEEVAQAQSRKREENGRQMVSGSYKGIVFDKIHPHGLNASEVGFRYIIDGQRLLTIEARLAALVEYAKHSTATDAWLTAQAEFDNFDTMTPTVINLMLERSNAATRFIKDKYACALALIDPHLPHVYVRLEPNTGVIYVGSTNRIKGETLGISDREVEHIDRDRDDTSTNWSERAATARAKKLNPQVKLPWVFVPIGGVIKKDAIVSRECQQFVDENNLYFSLPENYTDEELKCLQAQVLRIETYFIRLWSNDCILVAGKWESLLCNIRHNINEIFNTEHIYRLSCEKKDELTAYVMEEKRKPFLARSKHAPVEAAPLTATDSFNDSPSKAINMRVPPAGSSKARSKSQPVVGSELIKWDPQSGVRESTVQRSTKPRSASTPSSAIVPWNGSTQIPRFRF